MRFSAIHSRCSPGATEVAVTAPVVMVSMTCELMLDRPAPSRIWVKAALGKVRPAAAVVCGDQMHGEIEHVLSD